MILAFLFPATAAPAQTNNWISPGSGNWDVATNWSVGLPNSSQTEVSITNANSKAVAIQSTTPVNFPDSMKVQNIRLGGVGTDTNVLLMNYAGTTAPLRVLNNFNIEPNGRVLMLSSGLNVSNTLNLNGVFNQVDGELTFTNSSATIMQIEGGRFNLTNGVVNGANLYLGGATNGFAYQDSGLVSLAWLALGEKSTVPGSPGGGTYALQSGWLIVSDVELVGGNGFGTLTQNGGTNSAGVIEVGNGTYVKNGGGLFAGEISLDAPYGSVIAPPSAILTHAGGTATVTNQLRLVGQGNRHNPHIATFNMFAGSLTTPRIQMEEAGVFTQTDGTVNVANELFIDDNGGNLASFYLLSGGNLFTSDTTVSSSYPENSSFSQSGGTNIVADTVWINGSGMYQMTGGRVRVPNIKLTGSLNYPPQFFVNGAPGFAIENQTITSLGGAIVIENSAQQFGQLTLQADSGITFAGNSAVLRFADSHANSWQSELAGVTPQLLVYNWNGSTNGSGADQLIFGASSSALTADQVMQIRFINPGGFPAGTYPARMLSSGEVVPMTLPTLALQKNGANLVISWPGDFTLQSATNVVGPYVDVTNASSPYTANVNQFPMQFFRLRDY